MSAASTGLSVSMLSPCYWPEVRRGTERTIHGLAEQLLARGLDVRLITSAPQRLPTYDVEDGLPILRLPRPWDRRFERRWYEHYVTHLPLSYAALRAWGGDVVHAWYQTDALVGARWKRKRGTPLVFSYMGVPDHPGLTLRRRRLQITVDAVKAADAVVGVSAYVATQFERWLGVTDARVVYPPIDLETFKPDAELRSDQPTIVCAATPDEPRKRIPLLVEAFARVRREHPEARLLLQRPSNPAMQEALDGPGIEWADPAEPIAAQYVRAWVSALPSVGDAFGMVLAESLACGTPVVASNRDALPEVVDRPEVGRLFDGDDAKAVAGALLDAIEMSQDTGTPAACRARAEDFSPERCADGYEALYAEVLGR